MTNNGPLLNKDEKIDILEMYNTGNWSQNDLAQAFGVSRSTIARAIKEARSWEAESDTEVYNDEEDWAEYEDADILSDESYNTKYQYSVVATKNNITLYRTDLVAGGSETANLSAEDYQQAFDHVMNLLKTKGVTQENLAEIWRSIDVATFIEEYSMGTLTVIPATGQVYGKNASGEKIEFSGELCKQLLRSYESSIINNSTDTSDRTVSSLVQFAERLANNPSKRAVSELYEFIRHSDIKILEDGMVECYKKVRSDFMDIYSGTMDNSVGQVLEIPRDQVDPDSNRTCSYGLHVCSKTYLSHYGGSSGTVVVKVIVDPADFVAIPSDYNLPIIGQDNENDVAPSKARVCRYEVVGIASDADLI